MNPRVKTAITAGGLTFLLFVSGLLVWLTPMPLLYQYHKNGRGPAITSFVIALLAVAFIYFGVVPWIVATWGKVGSSPLIFWLPGMGSLDGAGLHPGFFGLSYLSFYGLIGIFLGLWEPKEFQVTRLVGKILLILTLLLTIWLAVISGGRLTALFHEAENYFGLLLNQMAGQIPEDATPEIRDQLAILKTHGDTIVYYAVRLIPGMLMAMTLFVVWLNLVVARKLFVKDELFKKLGPLRNWQMPFGFVWLLIGMAVLLLADVYWIQWGLLKILALNFFIVFGLSYFLQGLAILAFYGQKWSIPPLVKLLGYLIFLLFFQPIGVLLLGVGFFDSWFDFRKLTAKSKAA